MQVIGIGGQARSGKDTLADYLQKSLGVAGYAGPWQRGSFAASVKKCFCDYFGQTPEFIEEWKVKDEIPDGFLMPIRKALQFIGDGFRQIQAGIWIEACFRLNPSPLIISDARYINEAKAVRNHGGVNVLMWRPGYENDDPNPSESQLKPLIDYCVSQEIDGEIWPNSSLVRYYPPPGLEHYGWFFRNDGTTQQLCEKADATLVPYIERKLRSFTKPCKQGAA